jgi:hypothetical protein
MDCRTLGDMTRMTNLTGGPRRRVPSKSRLQARPVERKVRPRFDSKGCYMRTHRSMKLILDQSSK